MSTPATVPMFDPQGNLGDVPYEQMRAAANAGAIPAVNVIDPQGNHGYIPANRLRDAVQAGAKVLPYEQQEVQHPGFWSNLMGDLNGVVQSMPSMMGAMVGPTPVPLGGTRVAVSNPGGQQLSNAIAGGPGSLVANTQGMRQSAEQGDVGGVLGHAVAATLLATAPLTLGGLLKGGAAIQERIPSFERAGEAFKDVSAAAGKVPVDLSQPGSTALRLMELRDSGSYMPRSVSKFLQEATDPSKPPMTFDRVRDFASTASRLSVDEYNRMTPNVQRLVGQFARQLNDAAGDAAGSVGKQEAFEAAMQEWRNASKMAAMKQGARSAAAKMGTAAAMVAAGAAGAGLVAYPFRHSLFELLSGAR